jgi:hypothetical protein
MDENEQNILYIYREIDILFPILCSIILLSFFGFKKKRKLGVGRGEEEGRG